MMREAEVAHRIEVGLKSGMRDPLGERIKRRIGSDLGLSVKSVKTISVYTLDMDLSKEQLDIIAHGLLLGPVIQESRIDKPLAQEFDWLVEVGFKPGVTDNVGKNDKGRRSSGKPASMTSRKHGRNRSDFEMETSNLCIQANPVPEFTIAQTLPNQTGAEDLLIVDFTYKLTKIGHGEI